jgi:hypothetical protein
MKPRIRIYGDDMLVLVDAETGMALIANGKYRDDRPHYEKKFGEIWALVNDSLKTWWAARSKGKL